MSAGNEPAYPRETWSFSIGLTKRELIAAMAMQGLSANAHESLATCDYEKIATHAVKQADALLAQLSKEPGHEGG